MNKTYIAKAKDEKDSWYFMDANGQVLGKLAASVAALLMGKNSPMYIPGAIARNHVVVTNASHIAVTGNKMQDKFYYRHSGYPGGLRKETLAQIMESNPAKAIEIAVKGMLPLNKLRKRYMANLHVYAGAEHPYEAQKKSE